VSLNCKFYYYNNNYNLNHVCLDFSTVLSFGNEPVYIINVNIEDNPEEATIGAFLIHDLVTWV